MEYLVDGSLRLVRCQLALKSRFIHCQVLADVRRERIQRREKVFVNNEGPSPSSLKVERGLVICCLHPFFMSGIVLKKSLSSLLFYKWRCRCFSVVSRRDVWNEFKAKGEGRHPLQNIYWTRLRRSWSVLLIKSVLSFTKKMQTETFRLYLVSATIEGWDTFLEDGCT